jgi:hypothetical protein
MIETLRSEYPVVMTELAADTAGAPGTEFLTILEKMGVSWGYLNGQGFTDAATGQTHGWIKSGRIYIRWPKG